MIKTLKQLIHSRIVWMVAVAAWLLIAGELWYDGMFTGFNAVKTTQVVIATALAVAFTAAFVVNRGWQKRRRQPDRRA